MMHIALDSELTFDAHVSAVCKNIDSHFRVLRHTSRGVRRHFKYGLGEGQGPPLFPSPPLPYLSLPFPSHFPPPPAFPFSP